MKIEFSGLLLAIFLLLSAPASQAQSVATHPVAVGCRPAIASDSAGWLHAAFEADVRANKVTDIFYTKSTDHGIHWTAPKDISIKHGLSQHPAIAVENSAAIDVVWTDASADPGSPDIFFTRSADGGQTWSKPIDISSTPGLSAEPAIAIGPDDSINVVWSDTTKGDKNREIFYACSRDGGKTWHPPIDISNTAGVSSEPALAVGPEGIVHAAWADTTSTSGETKPDIYYAQATNDSWTTPVKVCNSLRISSHPALACSRNKIFLAWSDNSRKLNAPDVWLVIGSPAGIFGTVSNISDTPGVSTEPRVAVRGDDLVIVWSDFDTTAKTSSICALGTTDTAGDFAPCINLSNAHDGATHPDVTICAGKMYAIWEQVTLAHGPAMIQVSSVDIKGLDSSPVKLVDPKHPGQRSAIH